MATNFCPQCAAPRDPAHNACPNCGYLFTAAPSAPAPATAPLPATRYDSVTQLPGYTPPPPELPWPATCPQCQASNLENRKRCASCGYVYPSNAYPRGPQALAWVQQRSGQVAARPQTSRRRLWLFVGALILVVIVLSALTKGPTATSSAPRMTPSEQAYVDTVTRQSGEMGTALTSLSAHLSAPQIGDSTWTIETAADVAAIRNIVQVAQHMTAPASLRTVDTYYQQAMTHFDNAMTLLTQGIDQRDAKVIQQGGTEMDTASARIADATTALNAFQATHK